MFVELILPILVFGAMGIAILYLIIRALLRRTVFRKSRIIARLREGYKMSFLRSGPDLPIDGTPRFRIRSKKTGSADR